MTDKTQHVLFSRILSIACSTSSSTFAFSAAASTGTPPHASSYLSRSYGLTAPGLPSSRFMASGEMSSLKASDSLTRQPHEVYPGGVYIYDLKSQKQKVRCDLCFCQMHFGCLHLLSLYVEQLDKACNSGLYALGLHTGVLPPKNFEIDPSLFPIKQAGSNQSSGSEH